MDPEGRHDGMGGPARTFYIKTEDAMPGLCNLDGTDRKDREAVFVHSGPEAVKKLSKELSVTGAGDNGAFNVWVADDGLYWCQSYRLMVTLETKTFALKKDVGPWVKKWLKKIA